MITHIIYVENCQMFSNVIYIVQSTPDVRKLIIFAQA